MDGQGLHVTAAKRQTAGKILASHQPCLWQDAPNPCFTDILYTFVHAHMHPKVLTLAHASSHVSTIHTCVSSRPRLHSHTPGHPQHTARSQNSQVRTHYRCMRFTFSRAGLSPSNFLTPQVTPTHAGTHVTRSLSRSCTPRRVPQCPPRAQAPLACGTDGVAQPLARALVMVRKGPGGARCA